jgi:hypothetical protein
MAALLAATFFRDTTPRADRDPPGLSLDRGLLGLSFDRDHPDLSFRQALRVFPVTELLLLLVILALTEGNAGGYAWFGDTWFGDTWSSYGEIDPLGYLRTALIVAVILLPLLMGLAFLYRPRGRRAYTVAGLLIVVSLSGSAALLDWRSDVRFAQDVEEIASRIEAGQFAFEADAYSSTGTVFSIVTDVEPEVPPDSGIVSVEAAPFVAGASEEDEWARSVPAIVTAMLLVIGLTCYRSVNGRWS